MQAIPRNRERGARVESRMYIRQQGQLVTAHRRPHAPAFEERPIDPWCNMFHVEPDEPPIKLGGYRLAHVDARGDWRLDGSNRLVAVAPALTEHTTC